MPKLHQKATHILTKVLPVSSALLLAEPSAKLANIRGQKCKFGRKHSSSVLEDCQSQEIRIKTVHLYVGRTAVLVNTSVASLMYVHSIAIKFACTSYSVLYGY